MDWKERQEEGRMTGPEIAAVLISVVSAVGAVVSAIYAAKQAAVAKRATVLQMFESIFKEIRQLDARVAAHDPPDPTLLAEFFNTVEFLAYVINRKMLDSPELTAFFDEAFPVWYRTFQESLPEEQVKNAKFLPEFRKRVKTAGAGS